MNVAPHILVLATFLSVTWGIYMVYTVVQYRRVVHESMPKGRVIREFRRMVVAICLWLFVFSFLFRTLTVLVGLGDEVVGQVVFFALAGSNIVGSIFAVASLMFDDD